MKIKSIYWIGFAIMVMLQLFVPARMMMQSEGVLKSGKVYKFKTAPVDPNDPFRGKYITLSYDANSFISNSLDQFESGLNIYVTIEEGHDGFAEVQDVSYDRPQAVDNYVKAKVQSMYRQDDGSQLVTIEYPFNRFYLNEVIAPDVEAVYREALINSDQETYALVSLRSGRAVIRDVLVGGQSVTELTK